MNGQPKDRSHRKSLTEQIFSLPLNELSDIIEDSSGYHIIRVLERQDAGLTPLSEVQDDIRGNHPTRQNRRLAEEGDGGHAGANSRLVDFPGRHAGSQPAARQRCRSIRRDKESMSDDSDDALSVRRAD